MLELLIGVSLVAWISLFGAGPKSETSVSYPHRKPTAYERRTLQQTAKFYPGKDMTEFLRRKR